MSRRHGFSMIEMATVIFLVAILLSSTVSLMVNGLRGLSLSDQRAQMNQLIPVWQTAWQATFRGTDPADWGLDGQTLHAGPVTVELKDNELWIRSGPRALPLALPAIVSPTLSIEPGGQRADCAILQLEWESRFLTSRTTNRVRFVACGRGRP